MIPMISGPCETAGEQAYARDHDPGFGAGDGGFEVFGEAAIAPEPGKGAFHHPSSRLDLEAFGAAEAFDDLDGPLAELGERIVQLAAAIDAIGEDVAQLAEHSAHSFKPRYPPIAFLTIAPR